MNWAGIVFVIVMFFVLAVGMTITARYERRTGR